MKKSIFHVIFEPIKHLSGDLRLIMGVLKYEDLIELVTEKSTFDWIIIFIYFQDL